MAVAAGVVGTLAAWLVARTDLPGRRVLRLLLPLPLVMPSFIGAFALIAAFATGGIAERMLSPLGVGSLPRVQGFLGAFVVLTLLTYPYVYLPVAARLRQLLAGDGGVGAAAGAAARPRPSAPWCCPRRARRSPPAALLVFLYVIADFGAVQLLRYDTLTRAIYANRLIDPPVAAALSLVLGVLAILVVLAQRRVTGRGPADVRRDGRPLQVAARALDRAGARLRGRAARAGPGGAAGRARLLGGARRRGGLLAQHLADRDTRTGWWSRPSTRPSPAAPRPSSPSRWCCRWPSSPRGTAGGWGRRPTPW